ncbi:MAG TPA: sensor histidine kinase [Falsiroseomonas sp.]|nr:sensor histidine kinase [Falsiroseomonas sp.]
MLLLAVLPVFALGTLSIAGAWQAEREQAARRLARDRDHAIALNRTMVEAAAALLATLALTEPSAGTPCDALLAPARAAGLAPVLVDFEGAVLCGTAAPPSGLARLRGVTRPVVEPARGAAVLVAHPLGGDGGFAAAEVPLRAPATDLRLWMLDSAGGAQPVRAGPEAPPRPQGSGAARLTSEDGTVWLAAAGTVAPGIEVLVARPDAPLRRAALLMALRRLSELAALLCLGGLAVFLGLGRSVTRPLARLRAAVARWMDGEALDPEAIAQLPEELRDLAQAFRDGTAALAERDAALSAAVTRAELLAEEVHHRVKNNLQIVSSLLALQAGRVADAAARAEFEATRDRVAALATLHRHMYLHHDPDAIDPRAFLQELGEQLFAAVGERPGRRIAFQVDASPLRIASDQAVPLALLITEAVSVALRHGFPGTRRGRIAIRLVSTDARAQLTIEDDGAWPRADDRLRTSLMRGFARQLGSELHMAEGQLSLDLPLRPPLPRQLPRLRAAS